MITILLRLIGVLLIVPGLAWEQFGLSQWLDSGYKTMVFAVGFTLYLSGALISQFQRTAQRSRRKRSSDDTSEESL